MQIESPYILTARMNVVSAEFFTQLRTKYFPRERNFLSAHITLFHALPANKLEIVCNSVKHACLNKRAIAVRFDECYSLGAGVAFPISNRLLADQRELWRKEWSDFLGKQDQAKKRLHVTIQNKVTPDIAKQTLDEVYGLPLPPQTMITGFDLYRYDGGPWQWTAGWDLE